MSDYVKQAQFTRVSIMLLAFTIAMGVYFVKEVSTKATGSDNREDHLKIFMLQGKTSVDVATIKSDVSNIKEDITDIKDDLKAVLADCRVANKEVGRMAYNKEKDNGK